MNHCREISITSDNSQTTDIYCISDDFEIFLQKEFWHFDQPLCWRSSAQTLSQNTIYSLSNSNCKLLAVLLNTLNIFFKYPEEYIKEHCVIFLYFQCWGKGCSSQHQQGVQQFTEPWTEVDKSSHLSWGHQWFTKCWYKLQPSFTSAIVPESNGGAHSATPATANDEIGKHACATQQR